MQKNQESSFSGTATPRPDWPEIKEVALTAILMFGGRLQILESKREIGGERLVSGSLQEMGWMEMLAFKAGGQNGPALKNAMGQVLMRVMCD